MAERVTWDPVKAISNLKKHGVSFEEAAEIFEDRLSVTVRDLRHNADERRFFTVGQSRRDRLLTVGHTAEEDEFEDHYSEGGDRT